MSTRVATAESRSPEYSVKPSSEKAEQLVLTPQSEKAIGALHNLLNEARPIISRGEVPGVWNNLGLARHDGVLVEIPIGADSHLVSEPICKLNSIAELLAGKRLTNVLAMTRAGAWSEPSEFVRCRAKPLILSALIPFDQIETDLGAGSRFRGTEMADSQVIVKGFSLVDIWRIGLFRARVQGEYSAQVESAWRHSCDELKKLLGRISSGPTLAAQP
jgi:hypothetical protein